MQASSFVRNNQISAQFSECRTQIVVICFEPSHRCTHQFSQSTECASLSEVEAPCCGNLRSLAWLRCAALLSPTREMVQMPRVAFRCSGVCVLAATWFPVLLLLMFLFCNAVAVSFKPHCVIAVGVVRWNTWCTQNRCGVDWCTSSEVLDVATDIKENGMLEVGCRSVPWCFVRGGE